MQRLYTYPNLFTRNTVYDVYILCVFVRIYRKVNQKIEIDILIPIFPHVRLLVVWYLRLELTLFWTFSFRLSTCCTRSRSYVAQIKLKIIIIIVVDFDFRPSIKYIIFYTFGTEKNDRNRRIS